MSSVASPHPSAQQFRDRYAQQKQKPFRNDQPLIGPPDCSWASFRRPLLRACPLSQQQITCIWHDKLGYGVDGTVWEGRDRRTLLCAQSGESIQYNTFVLGRAPANVTLPVLGQQGARRHALLGFSERMPKRRPDPHDSIGRRDINRAHISQKGAKVVERRCPKPSRLLHGGQPRTQISRCA